MAFCASDFLKKQVPSRAFTMYSLAQLSYTKTSYFWSHYLSGTFPHSLLKQYIWGKKVFIGIQKSHARKEKIICLPEKIICLLTNINKQALSVVKSSQQINRKAIISCSSTFICSFFIVLCSCNLFASL